jgi:hypothetical protein
MEKFASPKELTRQDAIRVALEETERTKRKHVARVNSMGKFFVVPLFQLDREGFEHDAGYASLGPLVEESM